MSQCPSPSHSRPSIHYFYFINFFILFRVHVARVLLLPVRIYVSNKSHLPFLILILSLHNTLPFYISRQIFALFLSLKITHHRFPLSFSLFITLFLFTLHAKCHHSSLVLVFYAGCHAWKLLMSRLLLMLLRISPLASSFTTLLRPYYPII